MECIEKKQISIFDRTRRALSETLKIRIGTDIRTNSH